LLVFLGFLKEAFFMKPLSALRHFFSFLRALLSKILAKVFGFFVDFLSFFTFLFTYLFRKLFRLPRLLLNTYFLILNSLSLLKFKFTAKLIWGRGKLFRPLTHLGIISLALVTIITGGILSGTPLVRSAQGFDQTDYLSLSDVLENYVSPETEIPEGRARGETIDYEVVAGDTLSSIGMRFRISVDAIRYANNLSDEDSLRLGQKLTIPPIEGAVYTIRKGDTVSKIAARFKVPPQAIIEFNYIADDNQLVAGQKIIVPEAEIPAIPPKFLPPPLASKGPVSPVPLTAYKEPGTSGGIEGATGAFGWPLNTRVITQYFKNYHLGIDIDGNTGDPIFVADGGVVLRAGWWLGGFGNAVKIDHGNGFTSTYAHMSQINVSVGQKVNKGQVIGRVGNTGRSFGSHLHFTIQNGGKYLNPLTIF